MNLLTAENISKSYGVKPLFKEVTFGIEEGEKIGLIGINGTGKSTFLKILAGIETGDQGKVVVGRSVRVGYLSQDPVFDGDATVLQQVMRDGRIAAADEWQVESEAKTILTKLGIFDFDARMNTLSGGQRKRVALAGVLINPAELLILDEPTNHLDDAAVEWLETYLNRRKGALLMITHDRYFLDRVVNRIIELDKGRLFSYEGNYSKFLELKLMREELEYASEQKRLNLYRNELKWIKRGARARTTKQKARIDRFEKLQEEKIDISNDKIDISIGAARLGKKVISLEGVSKGYGGSTFIEDFSYTITRDDRVGIVGANGIGKSTLLNMIAGRLKPDRGTIDVGPTVKVGVFSQESHEMNENLRVIEYVKEEAAFISTTDGKLISAAQMLERFLFPSDLQWTPISKISGGERRRLYLLRILMSAPNVLMLDEPTNDLDVQTLTVLEDYLEDYPGAVVAVSHDRYFLDKVVDKILAFTGRGNVETYIGNYSEYLDAVKLKNTGDQTKGEAAVPNTSGKPNNNDKAKAQNLKFTFKEQKEFEQIDDDIADAEARLADTEQKIGEAGSDFVRLQELTSIQTDVKEELELLMERWVYLNDLAERIAENKKNKA